MTSLYWETASNGSHNAKAVVGGLQNGSEDLYCARATVGGEVTPGKLVVSHNCAYIPWGGKENRNTTYEVLVNPQGINLEWVAASDGQAPTGAVQGGQNPNKSPAEVMYIARANHDSGDIVPGKLVPSHKVCYIPWGGKEVRYSNYEVLCVKSVNPQSG